MPDYHRGKRVAAYIPDEIDAQLAALPGTTMRERLIYAIAAAAAGPAEPPATVEVITTVLSWPVRDKRRLVLALMRDAQDNEWDIGQPR